MIYIDLVLNGKYIKNMRIEYIVIIIASIFIVSASAILKIDRNYHYKKLKYLLSKYELNFYLKLIKVIPTGYNLMTKVRLADVIKSADYGRKYMYGFDKIKSKHLDFVIIDSRTSEIKVAIELNDNSHNLLKRQTRDEFVAETLYSVGIPLLMATTDNYNKIQQELGNILK